MSEQTAGEGMVTHVVYAEGGATETHVETQEEHAACLARLHDEARARQAEFDGQSASVEDAAEPER